MGVVEGVVKYARLNFLVPVPEVKDLAELNDVLAQKCRDDLKRRLRGKDGAKNELLKDSNQEEIKRLHFLHCQNLGADSSTSKSTLYGIFSPGAKLIWGSKRREFNIDHVVEVCEQGFAYDGALLISALCEFVEAHEQEDTGELVSLLQLFQKRIKYGLPNETTITLYELGFSDRVISQDLANKLGITAEQKYEIVKTLQQNEDVATDVIENYPAYFQARLNQLL